jgi:proteasome lid subunit RPN8/RPN11
MIAVPFTVLAEIRAHGEESYPEECCGALLGATRGGDARVDRAERMRNASRELRRRRYEIDPRDYLSLERRVAGLGLTVLGFYHSHPDHPAAPSEHDRERALPFVHYLILTVSEGRAGEATSWVLADDGAAFEPETLKVENAKE